MKNPSIVKDLEHSIFVATILNNEYEFKYIIENDKALANMLYDMITKLKEE